jgi:hypothetical protein
MINEQVRRLLGTVGMRARRGETLSAIEDEVIAPSGLSDEDKTQLRLHAWTSGESGRGRYQQRQDRVRRRAGRGNPVLGGE